MSGTDATEKKKKTYTLDGVDVDHYEYEGHLRVKDLELVVANRIACRKEEIERHEMMREEHSLRKVEHSVRKMDIESAIAYRAKESKFKEDEAKTRRIWAEASMVQAEAFSAIAEILRTWEK